MKLRLPAWALRVGYKFIDIEALGEASVLEGRTLEYGFAIASVVKHFHLSGQSSRQKQPLHLLDVGCTARINPIPSTFCKLGWRVTGSDLRDYKFSHPNFTFKKGDILDENDGPLSGGPVYDAVTLVSTLEHIGISGRYGISTRDESKGLRLLRKSALSLRAGGMLVVTIPQDSKSALEKGYSDAELLDLLGEVNMAVTSKESVSLGNEKLLMIAAVRAGG